MLMIDKKFVIKFGMITTILFIVFFFLEPHYKSFVRRSFFFLLYLFDFNQSELPTSILIALFPFVPFVSLLISIPRIKLLRKIKFTLIGFLVFYFTNILFALVQAFFRINLGHAILIQEFLTITIPLTIIFLFIFTEIRINSYSSKQKE